MGANKEQNKSGSEPTISGMTAVLGAFTEKRRYSSKGALWSHLGKRMPYSELKSILTRLERDGIVRISNGKVSLCKLPELTTVKMGRQSEVLEDPAKRFGPLLVYYKANGRQRITSSTADLEYMNAIRKLFRQKGTAAASDNGAS